MFLGLFNDSNVNEIYQMAVSNKIQTANRRQFKNFSKANSQFSLLIFEILCFMLNKVISKYKNEMKKDDKEKNVFLIQPIIESVFTIEIIPLFNNAKSLLDLLSNN